QAIVDIVRVAPGRAGVLRRPSDEAAPGVPREGGVPGREAPAVRAQRAGLVLRNRSAPLRIPELLADPETRDLHRPAHVVEPIGPLPVARVDDLAHVTVLRPHVLS